MFESIFEVIPSVDYVSKNHSINWSKDFQTNVEIFKKLEKQFVDSIYKSIFSMTYKGWVLCNIFHEKDQTQLLFRRFKNGA